MKKIIIAGGRDFQDYDFLKSSCQQFLSDDITIVSGCAKGADLLGEKWATENKLEIKKFPADWNRFGKSAGFKRNAEMAKYADVLVAFWDGKSKGTAHMIKCATDSGLEVNIFRY